MSTSSDGDTNEDPGSHKWFECRFVGQKQPSFGAGQIWGILSQSRKKCTTNSVGSITSRRSSSPTGKDCFPKTTTSSLTRLRKQVKSTMFQNLFQSSSIWNLKAKTNPKVSKTRPKTPAQKISQLVTDSVQQSAFTELISSSDIWWSSHAYCLSCEGRRPVMPSGGSRVCQDFASQQPMITLPLTFLPLQQQFSSMQIVHQTSVSLLYPSVWALHILYLFCNHFLFPWLSISAGRTVKIIMLRLARCNHFPTHLHYHPLPSPCKNTQTHLIPANHSGFSAGFYVTIKTHPCIIPR